MSSIATDAGISRQRVSSILGGELAKAYIGQLVGGEKLKISEVTEAIARGAESGVKLLAHVVENGTLPDTGEPVDAKTRIRAAEALLDRHGETAKLSRSTNDHRHQHIILTPEKLAELRARKTAKKYGTLELQGDG